MTDHDILVDCWEQRFGNKTLVTKAEAADFLRWSPRTIDRRIKDGLMKACYVRGSGKYRKTGPKLRESIREWEVLIPKTEVLKQFILMDELGGGRREKRLAKHTGMSEVRATA